jgi:sec-independent protein translocase protein TatA
MSMKLLSLVVLLVIVMLLFGTRRLRNVGEDLAEAIKSFRKGLKDQEKVEKDD